MDLAAEGKKLDQDALELMYQLKTGRLLRASVAVGHLLSTSMRCGRADGIDQFR